MQAAVLETREFFKAFDRNARRGEEMPELEGRGWEESGDKVTRGVGERREEKERGERREKRKGVWI